MPTDTRDGGVIEICDDLDDTVWDAQQDRGLYFRRKLILGIRRVIMGH
jgi:hypothetical protein